MDLVQSSLKAATVSGIFFIWAHFTKEAFNFSWHIITTLPEKETYKAVTKFMCNNCGELYDDDEERRVIDGILLCDFCRLKKIIFSIYHV